MNTFRGLPVFFSPSVNTFSLKIAAALDTSCPMMYTNANQGEIGSPTAEKPPAHADAPIATKTAPAYWMRRKLHAAPGVWCGRLCDA